MKTRPPTVAGAFYPADSAELKSDVEQYIEESKDTELKGELKAIIAPHAGYVYSGVVAGAAYKQVKKSKHKPKTVWVLAPSHSAAFEGLAIGNFAAFETPLGTIPVSKVNENLMEEDVSILPQAHVPEHSLEVQLPFLQVVLKDFELVPILVGETDQKRDAQILLKYLDDKSLIVVSSDLSHYHPYEEAKQLDQVTNKAIKSLDIQGLASCEACGKKPIMILLEIAKEKGWEVKLLDYRNSGDTAGDKSQVVGYSAFAFYKP